MRKATDNKRRLIIHHRNNHEPSTTKPFKRLNVTKVINTGRVKRSRMEDLAPMHRTIRAGPKGNGWFELELQGHFKSDLSKIENMDGGNRDTQGWVYAVGTDEEWDRIEDLRL
ncbi:hypothetical protein Tco_0562700 [Tanacetum coccineum]